MHTPVSLERREEQQLENTGVCETRPEGRAICTGLSGAGTPRQADANFRSLIAAKSLTSPPMRLVA
jgi:hypothetical protein